MTHPSPSPFTGPTLASTSTVPAPVRKSSPTRATWSLGFFLAAVVVGLLYAYPGSVPMGATALAVFLVGAPVVAVTTRRRSKPLADADAYDPWLERWKQARRHHDTVLSEYGAWELDPEKLLTAPGLWDYSRPEIQDFFDTMTRAGQLATETYPGPGAHTNDYVTVVDTLRRSWHEASRYALATGLNALDADSRSRAETALKLWRHAQSTSSEAERETYARRALGDINELVRRRILPGRLRGIRAIETAAHGELEA